MLDAVGLQLGEGVAGDQAPMLKPPTVSGWSPTRRSIASMTAAIAASAFCRIDALRSW
ncbi:hypothetical protein AB0I60_30055 [Actinosynnema sp. NPDC050436]|uniref:hypothetical protein n=1 Tax=Actinosynnema sp. NPDC050436 TaxID=3155659 RepID=UPI0033DA31DD